MAEQSPIPVFASWGDVVRWVIEETDALCPSPERLAAYADSPHEPALSDVRYHVEEAACRLCRAELIVMRCSSVR
jgi:hypothetical protein